MATNEQLTCVVSGSFSKFKPEIDALHEEFLDHGIKIIAPDKGWTGVEFARSKIIFPAGFRPLPSERGMTPAEIEQEFLRCLGRAHFLYLHNQDGYLGNSAYFELGNAIAATKPVYAKEQLVYETEFEDLSQWISIRNYVRLVPLPEIAEDYHQLMVRSS